MNACLDWEPQISTLIDGHCPNDEVLPILDHTLQCESCRHFYLQARSLDCRLAELRNHRDELPMPGPLWDRISLESGLHKPRLLSRIKVAVWAPLLAAVLFLFLGLNYFKTAKDRESMLEAGQLEIVLESNARHMTERRFVGIAKELLESDRKYHQQMLFLMQDITQAYADLDREESPDWNDEAFPMEGKEELGENSGTVGL